MCLLTFYIFFYFSTLLNSFLFNYKSKDGDSNFTPNYRVYDINTVRIYVLQNLKDEM